MQSQRSRWRRSGATSRIWRTSVHASLVESVSKIDSDSAIFRIKLKVGYLSRTFEIKAKLKDVFSPDRVAFSGEGSDAEIRGNLELKEQSTSVSVKYRLEIRPVSVTGKTAIAMIGKDLVKKQASEFASCVKAKLENSV